MSTSLRLCRAENFTANSRGVWAIQGHPLWVCRTGKGEWSIHCVLRLNGGADISKAHRCQPFEPRAVRLWLLSAGCFYKVYSTRAKALDALQMALEKGDQPWRGPN